MFEFLSLRGRFLITPIIGIILTIILYIASNAIINSHSELFQELRESNLPQISEVSRSITLLANNHNKLTEILLSSIESPDEETIYIEGRNVLNRLHEIEAQLLESINSEHKNFTERDKIHNKIHQAFIVYRDASINAIELSSVNSKLSVKELIDAGEAMRQLNNNFLALSEYHSQYLSNTSSLIGGTLNDQNSVTILAVVLILLMVFSALYFSDRISSDIEEYEQSLINYRIEADNANQAKSQFLSSMSHELRTPLNAILGFSQILEFNEKNEDKIKNIQEVILAGNHLLELINEILDLSKIESGNVDLSIENHSLNTILNYCLSMIKPFADKHAIQIDNKVSALPDININVDEMRFKQILLNLLSNAIKYNSKKGKVTIDYSSDNKDMLGISIADTGKGFTNKQLSHLFEPFERFGADNSHIEGTGLGLVITKDLIELMGGTIAVESEVEKGSRFIIHIPLS